MKIKTDLIKVFLNKARMSGKQIITEALFKFEEDGLKIDANSVPPQSRVMGWLQRVAFEDYEKLGNIGLNDLSNFVKVLTRFGDTITISKEGNLLTLKEGSKTVDIELVSENFLATDTKGPNLEFDQTLSLTAAQLKGVYNDVLINEDAVITIETDDKKIKFSNTGKYKFRNELSAPSCTPGVKVSFGQPLIDATSNLDGNLEISLKSNYPIKVREITETSVITIITAPRVVTE